jgi:hypothetical protein
MLTREQVDAVIEGGHPFELRVADGREYQVPHRDFISVAPTGNYVIVYEANGHFTVLPLFLLTGIHAKASDNGEVREA